MQKLVLATFFLLFPCALLKAQSVPMNRAASDAVVANMVAQRLEQEMLLKYAEGGDSAQQQTEAREAEYRRLVFYNKAKKFFTLWTRFATELNDRQTFNVKLAREISKAFHDLESSEGWPVPPTKSAR